MRRLVMLLAAREPGGPTLEKAVTGYAADLGERAEAVGAIVRAGVQLDGDPLAAAAKTIGRAVAPLHALVEISSPSDEAVDAQLIGLVAGAAAVLGDVVDAARSTAVLGTVHAVTQLESGSLQLAVAARRIATISQRQLHEHWLGIHAPLALSMMPPGATDRIGYQQLHGETEANAEAAEAAGFPSIDIDGLLQVHMEAPEDFLSVATEPNFAKAIYEDELNFADQSELRGAFLRMA
jgi:hypothetical protein